MTKDKGLTIAEKFKEQLNTPKTQEVRYIETEDLNPDLGYEDISSSRGYGPSSGGIRYELVPTGSCPEHPLGIVAQERVAHWEKLIIRLVHGNFWYYTTDKTSGVGGDSSWWSICNFFTSTSASSARGTQWRTRAMRISSPRDAELTKEVLNDERILLPNGFGVYTDAANAKKKQNYRSYKWSLIGVE